MIIDRLSKLESGNKKPAANKENSWIIQLE